MDCGVDIIGDVPIELFLKIIDHLSFNDILSCQAVSRTWFSRVNCDFIWKKYLLKNLPDKEIHPRRDFRWMVMLACESKLKVLNHKRIIKNWHDDTFNRFEMENCDSSFCTSYDGKTFVVSSRRPNVSICVYNVERGKLWLQQTLKLDCSYISKLATNTKHIIALCGVHIAFFQLASTKSNTYKMAYVLCRDKSKIHKITSIPEPKYFRIHERKCHENLLESQAFFLLDDTLFIHYWASKYLCAWDINNKESLLKMPMCTRSSFVNDGMQLYASALVVVSVFNSRAELQFTIKPIAEILSMKVNKNVIVLILGRNILVGFDKFTGVPLFDVPSEIMFQSILHPYDDVLYDLSELFQVYAYHPKSRSILWENPLSDEIKLGSMLFVAGHYCLFLSSMCGSECDVVDTKTGRLMYRSIADGAKIVAYYDILIYYKMKDSRVYIHVYS